MCIGQISTKKTTYRHETESQVKSRVKCLWKCDLIWSVDPMIVRFSGKILMNWEQFRSMIEDQNPVEIQIFTWSHVRSAKRQTPNALELFVLDFQGLRGSTDFVCAINGGEGEIRRHPCTYVNELCFFTITNTWSALTFTHVFDCAWSYTLGGCILAANRVFRQTEKIKSPSQERTDQNFYSWQAVAVHNFNSPFDSPKTPCAGEKFWISSW